MNPQDAHNFAFMVAGYCRVYGNVDMVLTLPMAESTSGNFRFLVIYVLFKIVRFRFVFLFLLVGNSALYYIFRN